MTTLSFPAQEGRPPRPRAFAFLGLFLFGSLVFHAAGFLALSRWAAARPKPVLHRPVELVMFEVERPKPPPPPEEEKPPEPVKSPQVRQKPVKPPALKIAKSQPLPPPPDDAPPPPNDAPAPEPRKPALLVTGISLSSTSSSGSFAAPVGNTAYGRVADKTTAPAEVKAYSAPRYVPIHQVDSNPEVLSEVKVPYPEEAKRAGIEGTVVILITVDTDGKVVEAKLRSGPGFGLNEAAVTAVRRFRFKPAYKGGESVSTTMTYSYTFLLD